MAMVEGKTAGLPQLDPTLYPSQIFWLAVSFGLLFLLMTYVAIPAVRKAQDKRQALLRADRETISRLGQETWTKKDGARHQLEQARAEVKARMDAIILASHHEASAQEGAMQKRLGDQVAAAEARIAAARDAALRDVPQAAQDLANSILWKLQGGAAQ